MDEALTPLGELTKVSPDARSLHGAAQLPWQGYTLVVSDFNGNDEWDLGLYGGNHGDPIILWGVKPEDLVSVVEELLELDDITDAADYER